MYKPSSYNSLYKDGANNIIFNRISNSILVTQNTYIMNLFTGNLNCTETVSCKEYNDKLLSDGFIVPENVDEDNLNYLVNFDSVANKELKLIIMTTYRCNFRCTYCYQDFDPIDMEEKTIERIIKYVKKEIHKYSGLNVGWYGGEPLLNASLITTLSKQLIEICHAVNRKYTATITTNGYLLDEHMFKQMLKNHITFYQITIDGLEETHDECRRLTNGGGTFKKIVDNLRDISLNKSSAFTIKIRSNIRKNNLKSFDDYIKFLYKNFNNDRRFTFWFTAVSDYGGSSIANLDDKDLLYSCDEVYDLMISSKYYLNYSPYYYYLTSRSCIASMRNCFIISPDNFLLKCTVDLHDENNKIGYLNEMGEAIIDNYKFAKWIHYKRDPFSQCVKCENTNKCNNNACAKINNFPRKSIDCTSMFINEEKILKLLCRGNYKFIKRY